MIVMQTDTIIWVTHAAQQGIVPVCQTFFGAHTFPDSVHYPSSNVVNARLALLLTGMIHKAS